MNCAKNYFSPLLLIFFLCGPFLLPGQNILFQENFEGRPNPAVGWSRVEFPVYGKKPIRNTWFGTIFAPDVATNGVRLPKLRSETPNTVAIFNSGVICQDPYGDNAWFITPPINAKDLDRVILTFNTFYRSYNDRPQIRVGTKLTKTGNTITDKSLEDWATYEVFPGIRANQYGGDLVGDPTLNYQPISIDISAAAAGQETFYVAFQYLSDRTTINGGLDPLLLGCGYSWQIDDIKVISPSFETLACNETVVINTRKNGTISAYSGCNDGGPGSYPGGDNLFRFELTEAQTVVLELENEFEGEEAGPQTDLDLFLLQNGPGNTPGACIAASKTSGTSKEELVVNLSPGIYWAVTDQVANGFAKIRLKRRCFPNGSILQIDCGQEVVGTTVGVPNEITSEEIMACFGGFSPAAYDGGDRRYQVTITEESTVFVQLKNRNAGNVDAFLFADDNGQPGNCLGFGMPTGDGIDQLAAALFPGIYWLLIDSPDSGSETAFDLAFTCFPIDNNNLLSCGDAITSSTSGEPDQYGNGTYADCLPNVQVTPYQSGDRAYQFTLTERQTVSVDLYDIADQRLEFFLLNSSVGAPGVCIAKGISTGFPGESRITQTLEPGLYWVIVDGGAVPMPPNLALSEGPFEISLNCFAPQTAESGVLNCGDFVEGNTLGSAGDFSGPAGEHTAGDQTYLFEVAGNPQQILIYLAGRGLGDLDLFLYESDASGQAGALVAQSTRDSLVNEELFISLKEGFYLTVIDGKEDPVYSSEGPYSLTLNCFPLPTVCDLEESLEINSGNTIRSKTGFAIPNNDYSFEDGIIPVNNVIHIDCIAEVFSDSIYANIYTYYHDGNGSFTVNLLETDPGVQAFVFKCAESRRSAACLGALQNGTLTINNEAGFYNLMVGSTVRDLPFTIQVLSENPCLPEIQKPSVYYNSTIDSPLGLDELLADDSLEGETNDFNRNNYQACFDISSNYDGPDKVYTFEIRNADPETGVQYFSIQLNLVNTTDSIGLFLFNDLCDGSCIAFAEWGPNSNGTNLDLGIPALPNGIYYLVIDQASDGPPAQYEIGYAFLQGVYSLEYQDFHDITFTDFTLPYLDETKDRVFITYDRELTPDAYFVNTPVFWDTRKPGTLQDTKIFHFPYDGSGTKYGYEEGEQFLFIALTEGSYLELQPFFNTRGLLAKDTDRFRINGRSQVTNLTVRNVEELPALSVTPNTLVIAPTENDEYPVTIDTNRDWEIMAEDMPPWIEVLKKKGKEDEEIALKILPNKGKTARGASFDVQIIDPVTNARIIEPVFLQQRASQCESNTIEITAAEIVGGCAGTNNGSISINVTGTTGKPMISWSNGLGDQTTVSGLTPGLTYGVTVSDANECVSSKKFQIPVTDPPAPTHEEQTVCERELPYRFGTQLLTASGDYSETMTNEAGCDILKNLKLIVLPKQDSTISAQICEGTVYTLGKQQLIRSGTYTETFKDRNGCDSLVTLNLTVLEPIRITRDTQICESDVPYSFYGQMLTTSGIYEATFQDANNCNNFATLNLTVLESVRTTQDTQLCERDLPYSFYGQILTTSGIYQATFQDANNCDNFATLNLTVLEPERTTQNVQICESDLPYPFGDQMLTTSGTYFHTFTTADNCDNIVTLQLEVKKVVRETQDVTICDGDYHELGPQKLFTPGTYTWTGLGPNGCDSVVTVRLTVLQPPTSMRSEEVCEEDLPFAFDGRMLTTSGLYKAVHQIDHACDSIEFLQLTVLLTEAETIDIQICTGETYEFDNQILTESGRYTATVTDNTLCDKVVVLNLTVVPALTKMVDTDICQGDSITLNVGTFDQYQWSTGATTQSITVDTTGSYSVIVTQSDTCIQYDTVMITVLPELEIALTVTDESANGANNGSALVQISGGTPPYRVQWSNRSKELDQFDLAPGRYTIRVTDAAGCIKRERIEIKPFTALTLMRTLEEVTGLDNTQPNVDQFRPRHTPEAVTPEELKIIDTNSSDGEMTFEQGLQVFPNPVGERLYIRKETSFDQKIEVTLMDVLGRRTYQGIFLAETWQLDIDVSELAAGVYWLRFQTSEGDWSRKVIIN